MKKRIVALFLMLVVVVITFPGCVTSTNVQFNADVEGADLYIDGERIGTTPMVHKMSNAVWEDPLIILKKDGYKELHAGIKKEIKAVNLICGLIIWWPSLLWVYGPKGYQYFDLIEADGE